MSTIEAPGRTRRFGLAKLAKYVSASIAGVIVGQSTLFISSSDALLGWDPVIGNFLAATIGAVPNYAINRYWTWNKRGKNHLWKEVVPFWGLTIAGLLMSTLMVAYAEAEFGSQLAIQVANLAGYGSVWIIKLLVLEHVLFKTEE